MAFATILAPDGPAATQVVGSDDPVGADVCEQLAALLAAFQAKRSRMAGALVGPDQATATVVDDLPHRWVGPYANGSRRCRSDAGRRFSPSSAPAERILAMPLRRRSEILSFFLRRGRETPTSIVPKRRPHDSPRLAKTSGRPRPPVTPALPKPLLTLYVGTGFTIAP